MNHELTPIAVFDTYSRYECGRCGKVFRAKTGQNVLDLVGPCGEEGPAWTKKRPSRGLGDTIAKATSAVGIKPCGGCKKRQAALNRLLPYDKKMVSPKDQWCIQVEITNHCDMTCSNCTRHCPHVREPFYMDPDTFERAVRSMDGYEGMLGIMGGEPTLHPQFAELAETYDRLWLPDREATRSIYSPIRDFGEHAARNLSDVNCRRGLWSSLGEGYREHYELIQRVFPYQCLNDHRNGATHAPVLVSRKDLGIPNREWLRYRDSCWVQRLWSSSITPKGCFPCEIMASLDMLYDGPGGWPIEPGWWKRKPKSFGAMLDWCEMCGACLPLQPRMAAEGLHDVSRSHLAKLASVDSPALIAGTVVVHDSMPLVADPKTDPDWYMPKDQKRRRVHPANRSTKVRSVEAVVVCVDRCYALRKVLPRNAAELDRIVVVTATHDEDTFAECLKYPNVVCVVTDACYDGGDAFNKGRMLNAGMAEMRMDDWCLNLDADILLPENFREKITSLTLNPGCLYYTRRRDLTDDGSLDPLNDLSTNFRPWGYFQLWNQRASCLKNLCPLKYPDCFVSAGNVDTWWQHRWPADRRVPLSQCDEFDVGHVAHGPLTRRWNGEQERRGWRFIGQTNLNGKVPLYEYAADEAIRLVDIKEGSSRVIPAAEFDPKNIVGLVEYQAKKL